MMMMMTTCVLGSLTVLTLEEEVGFYVKEKSIHQVEMVRKSGLKLMLQGNCAEQFLEG